MGSRARSLSLGLAIAPAAWRIDDDGIACLAPKLVAPGHSFDLPLRPANEALAAESGLAARQSIGRNTPVAVQERDIHAFEKANDAGDTVAAAPSALSARIAAYRESLQDDGITEFEHFRVGQTRIGHMRVDGTRPIEAGAGARAAANRFIILVFGIPEIG